MKIILFVFLFSINIFAAGEVFWLTKIFDSAKDIAEKASDFKKSVTILEDLKIIEEEQAKDLKKQSEFLKDVDQSVSVIDYVDNQIETDHTTIETLDALYDASELTDKYFGYSPYEDVYIAYSDATLKTINDALADPKKANEIDSQDAANKLAAHQSAKQIIEQAKTNDLLAKSLANDELQRQANYELNEKIREKQFTRANDSRVFFSKFRRFMR
jgi:hypothetical protein